MDGWIDVTKEAANGRKPGKRGGSQRINGDSVAIGVTKSGDDLQVIVRVSQSLMEKARMFIGDRALLLYNPQAGLCLIKRTVNDGYVFSPSGVSGKGIAKKLIGKPVNAAIRFRWVESLPLKKDRVPLTECENIELGPDGILFAFPADARR